MKRLLIVVAILIPLAAALAADWNLVRVPAPQDPAQLEASGFELFHRAGDFWIGSLPRGVRLPSGGQILAYDRAGGEVFRLLLASPAEADKLTGKASVLYRDEDEVIIQAT